MAKDDFTSFPSRIPPDFVARTVQRLLPPNLDQSKLTAKQRVLLLQHIDELTEAVANDPVRYFQPSAGGQWDFLSCNDPDVQGLYFFAGNKSGKTTGAAILVGENAAGEPLWDRKRRTVRDLLLRGRTPLRICAFCEDFATHEETVIPTLLSWIPRRLLASNPIERGPSGNVVKVIFESGTHIYLRTYDQGYAKAEGKDYDLVWCDEPPARDIYTAIFRGLVATKGRLIISATLLTETWLYDELSQPFVRVFEATMYDNEWLDASARQNFEALLSEEERNIRIYGKPSSLTGKIYPSFHDKEPYVQPFVARLWNPVEEEPYPIIAGVDPHERKGLYIEWAWLTPDNKIVWFDWSVVPSGRLSDMFDAIARKEAGHSGPTRLVVIDPNRGTAKQMDDMSWQTAFEERGYEVMLGIDDINFGHSQVRELLGSDPQMYWLESCRGAGGPVWQMFRYTWDDYSRALRRERGPKEKPKQTHKDFPDIHRYVACAHLEYRMFSNKRGYDVLTLNNARTNANPYSRL